MGKILKGTERNERNKWEKEMALKYIGKGRSLSVFILVLGFNYSNSQGSVEVIVDPQLEDRIGSLMAEPTVDTFYYYLSVII